MAVTIIGNFAYWNGKKFRLGTSLVNGEFVKISANASRVLIKRTIDCSKPFAKRFLMILEERKKRAAEAAEKRKENPVGIAATAVKTDNPALIGRKPEDIRRVPSIETVSVERNNPLMVHAASSGDSSQM